MAGFIRRYSFSPGTEIITQIEGVVIVDLPPPGNIQGVGTGTTCVIGEYANMEQAVKISSTGLVTTDPKSRSPRRPHPPRAECSASSAEAPRL